MTTFEEFLYATPTQMYLAHVTYPNLLTENEHEMVEALLAMAED